MNTQLLAPRIVQKALLLATLLLAMAKTAVAGHATTVVTSNLLRQDCYRDWYAKPGNAQTQMPFEIRRKIMANYVQQHLSNAHAKKAGLVIAMQECDHQMMDVLQSLSLPKKPVRGSRSVEGVQDTSEGSHILVAGSPESSRLAFLVMGNWQKRFHRDCSHPDKKERQRFSVMQLTSRNASGQQETINVINVHCIGGPDMWKAANRHHQLSNIVAYIKSVKMLEEENRQEHHKQHWVVCGDFNLDVRAKPELYNDLLRDLRKTGVGFVDAFTTKPSDRITAYCRDKEECIDFIFVSPGLKASGSKIVPNKDPKMQLLSHGFGTSVLKPDNERQCYSDHCALRTTVKAITDDRQ